MDTLPRRQLIVGARHRARYTRCAVTSGARSVATFETQLQGVVIQREVPHGDLDLLMRLECEDAATVWALKFRTQIFSTQQNRLVDCGGRKGSPDNDFVSALNTNECCSIAVHGVFNLFRVFAFSSLIIEDRIFRLALTTNRGVALQIQLRLTDSAWCEPDARLDSELKEFRFSPYLAINR